MSSSLLWLPNPSSFADALCIEVDTGAGEDYFDKMLIANQAAVDWTSGKIDTESYLEVVDETLGIDPIDFVNETIELYLPGMDTL